MCIAIIIIAYFFICDRNMESAVDKFIKLANFVMIL